LEDNAERSEQNRVNNCSPEDGIANSSLILRQTVKRHVAADKRVYRRQAEAQSKAAKNRIKQQRDSEERARQNKEIRRKIEAASLRSIPFGERDQIS
jgi:hypothetical protein